MNFFEAQQRARRSTFWLVLLLVAAVTGLVLLTNLLVMGVLFYSGGEENLLATSSQLTAQFDLGTFLAIGAGVVAVVTLGSLYKLSQLAGGGRRVVEALGGQYLPGNSTDPTHRKILNVVEEMAIASGSPVPPVYLLEEDGINAFAAGWQPSDAVIGITRGAVERLSRDELQGVVAHEFSHIFNGDMRLNIQLTGILHGILVIGLIGRQLLNVAGLSRHRFTSRRTNNNGVALFMLLGVALMAIGYLGNLYGELIKMMISRQREYLADASAVQFTRNPLGIANALKKIGGRFNGSVLIHPAAAEFSHVYFARGTSGWLFDMLSTHPPLEARIRRIEPGWDGHFIKPAPLPQSSPVEQKPKPDRAQMAAVAMGVVVADALLGIDQMGNPSTEQVGYVRELLQEIPQPLHDEAKNPYGVRALIYALLLDGREGIRSKQWQHLERKADPDVFARIAQLHQQTHSLDARLRLPLIDLAMPAIRALSPEQYLLFRDNLLTLMRADNKIDLRERIIQHLVIHRADEAFNLRKRPKAKHALIGAVKQECEIMLSLLAHAEHKDPGAAQQAFNAGRDAIGAKALQLAPRSEITLAKMDQAMDALAQLKPLLKPRFLKACAACIASDGKITIAGVELLRAIASSLDSPMPPILVDH